VVLASKKNTKNKNLWIECKTRITMDKVKMQMQKKQFGYQQVSIYLAY